MARTLFRPFDLAKWLVLGFTAWLAGLGSCSGGGGGDASVDRDYAEELGRSAGQAWESLAASAFLLGLAAIGLVLLVSIVLLVIWLSARGKFMFLDNVLHDRARVVEPWKRFRRHGNSLFGFTLALVAAIVLLVAGTALAIAGTVGFGVFGDFEAGPAIALVAVAVSAWALMMVIVYTLFFLDGFVVPLMHRYDLGVTEAWQRFLAILLQRPWPFLLCGLLVLGVGIGVLIAIFVFGIMTCCIGFLFLIVPYVGSVLLLPISVFYRGFTVEFLAQFDPDLLGTPEAAG